MAEKGITIPLKLVLIVAGFFGSGLIAWGFNVNRINNLEVNAIKDKQSLTSRIDRMEHRMEAGFKQQRQDAKEQRKVLRQILRQVK